MKTSVARQGITLILGGYSYGSLITAHLPTTDILLERFRSVKYGTAEAEIRLRAVTLSKQWNKDVQSQTGAVSDRGGSSYDRHGASARSLAVVVGGEESSPGSQRPSHESRRSADTIQRSIDLSRRKLGLRQHSDCISERSLVDESLTKMDISTPKTYYLLISPLLPPISALVTMFSAFRSKYALQAEGKLVTHSTLAFYGDKDFFTSHKKLRRWAEGLVAKTDSHFQFYEIAGAGHFWQEAGAEPQMRESICKWAEDIIGNSR